MQQHVRMWLRRDIIHGGKRGVSLFTARFFTNLFIYWHVFPRTWFEVTWFLDVCASFIFFSPLSLPLDSPSMIHISDTCNRKPRGPGWHVRELFLNAIPFRRGIITMPEYDVVAECFNLCWRALATNGSTARQHATNGKTRRKRCDGNAPGLDMPIGGNATSKLLTFP